MHAQIISAKSGLNTVGIEARLVVCLLQGYLEFLFDVFIEFVFFSSTHCATCLIGYHNYENQKAIGIFMSMEKTGLISLKINCYS